MKKTGSSWMLFLVLTSSLADAQTDLTQDVAAYWRFDGNLSEVIGDIHGFVPRRSGSIGFVEGRFGKALRLNGHQFVEARGSERLSGVLSISFWMRAEGDAGTILDEGPESWYVSFEPPGFVSGFSDTSLLPPEQAFDDKGTPQWHHVVLVQRPWLAGIVYVDGVRLSEGMPRLTVRGELYPLAIGGRPGWRDGLFEGSLDELIIWKDRSLTDAEVAFLWNNGEGRELGPLLEDLDGDGLPDVWEDRLGLVVGIEDEGDDPDGDGYTNLEEYQLGLAPLSRDTDDDELPDSAENNTGVWDLASGSGTDPRFADTDEDGLLDGQENPDEETTPTDPNLWDSDGDGFGDGDEFLLMSDPSDGSIQPDMSDGLKAYWPFNQGIDDVVGNRAGLWGPSGSMTFRKSTLGYAVYFNGGQYVDVQEEDASSLGFLGESFTVSLWLHPEYVPEQRTRNCYMILSQGAGRGWQLMTFFEGNFFEEGMVFYVPRREFGGSLITGDKLFDAAVSHFGRMKTWHHIVGVYTSLPGGYSASENQPTVYINGIRFPLGRVSAKVTYKAEESKFRIGHPNMVGFYGWKGMIDDLVMWNRPLTESEASVLYRSGLEGRDLAWLISPNADEDGIPDDWEMENGLDPDTDDAHIDADEDGLTNLEEYAHRTNPYKMDTDEDGLIDGFESNTGRWTGSEMTGTNPLMPDSDGDGLRDGMEDPSLMSSTIELSKSDPNVEDTDGDGLVDGVEWQLASDPSDALSLPSLGGKLLAYWSLDGDAVDQAGSFDGELMGDVQYAKGRFGDAIQLSGRGDYIAIPGSEDTFAFVNEHFSVSVWFRSLSHPLDAGAHWPRTYHPTLLAKGGWDGWALGTRHGSNFLAFLAGFANALSPRHVPSFHMISDPEWHHAVGVVDVARSEIALYVDGKLGPPGTHSGFSETGIGVAVPGILPTITELRIGSNPGPWPTYSESHEKGSHWAGLIDEVAVWNRPLAPREVERLFYGSRSLEQLIADEARPRVLDDADQDGSTDKVEYFAGTKMFDPTDYFRILGIERTTNAVELKWSSVVTKHYHVEYSKSMNGPWERITAFELSSQGTMTRYFDRSNIRANRPTGFYRVTLHE